MLSIHVFVKESAISESLVAESALLLDSMMLVPCQLLLTKPCMCQLLIKSVFAELCVGRAKVNTPDTATHAMLMLL